MTEPHNDKAGLTKIPPHLAETIRARGEWSHCAMEHSRIDVLELEEPGTAFHHLALPLDRSSLSITLRMDGRCLHGRNTANTVAMIAAGAVGRSSWSGPLEAACLYFTDEALRQALGMDPDHRHDPMRTGIDQHAPALARLLRALHRESTCDRTGRALVGDGIFLAIAAHLVPQARQRLPARRIGEAWRVRNALAYIHAFLCEDLNIDRIASAAATSPYYLNHAFRNAMGCSIWRYVLRERARHAGVLVQQQEWTLTDIALEAGFDAYPSFIAAMRREFGLTPAKLRALARLQSQGHVS
ncbi:helix-turn-helix transcriptional regulator [Novosphingobium sp. UBA1939]|uniref:helix-turn-helix transcriptional regulator n=1 Tax=Novosphingobium sp. UBA1939 TaxID=1946982 RepID=UPI0025D07502|nr:AraC family transcriptional regulator [Novosphingobium sp. UBA1939]